ncbi:diguanylate cyclase (GGDEF) domain-containing protein [Duganella sp. CF458]|uniref:GGDEF domain-containing protein n=1 Tax=Duganella sp. CF458 TaxID=1884368 RepID=UPI0008EB5C6B|nr:GGDEF domain-containing protein [Duganella sp. CF458]SFG08308.1 diguanylate cyclase (GGDEF) domain-containing protein [Duganella sp. CF458]
MKNNPSFTTTELRHLLVLAGDLITTTDSLDALHSIGTGVARLFHPGALIIMLESHDEVLAIEFDGTGQRQPLGHHTGLSDFAQTLLSSEVESSPFEGYGSENHHVWGKFPYPAGVGIVVVSWPERMKASVVSSALAIVRDVAELTGAAMSKFYRNDYLEKEVANQARALADANSSYSNELDRRDEAERSLRQLSLTDELTGLNNRRGFFLDAERSFRIAQRGRMPCAVIFADVDNLKSVNDVRGHEAGDQLIRDAAAVFKESFRQADVIARLGGDEFAAFTVADDCPDRIIERIATRLQQFNQGALDRGYEVAISTGVVRCDPDSGMSLADYLLDADKAMYAIKRERRRKKTQLKPPGRAVKN